MSRAQLQPGTGFGTSRILLSTSPTALSTLRTSGLALTLNNISTVAISISFSSLMTSTTGFDLPPNTVLQIPTRNPVWAICPAAAGSTVTTFYQ